jgi:hypothetical protein
LISFMAGFTTVFAALTAWLVGANRGALWAFEVRDVGWWARFVSLAAPLLAAPVAGAWIGAEIATWLRPARAMHHRVRRSKRLMAAGLGAGMLSVAGSAAAFPFSDEQVPEFVVTGGLSMIFALLVLLPFSRKRVGHCVHCGYDLRGGATRATCPECGAVGSAA